MTFPQVTFQMIQDLDPCHDISQWLSEDWTGTWVELAQWEGPNAHDKVWTVLRRDFLGDELFEQMATFLGFWCDVGTGDFLNPNFWAKVIEPEAVLKELLKRV